MDVKNVFLCGDYVMFLLLKIHLDDFFIKMARVGDSNSSFLFAGIKHVGGVLLTFLISIHKVKNIG